MNDADPRVWRSDQIQGAVCHITGSRAMVLCPVAFAATGVWSAILYFGSWAAGFPIEAGWLMADLAVILLLLLLGLSMAAAASAHCTMIDMGAQEWTDFQHWPSELG